MKKVRYTHPVRKAVGNKYGSKCGYMPSRKLGRMVETESLLERSYFAWLECDPNVVTYCEQPTVIDYEWKGQIKKYYPDAWVQYKTHEAFKEVKPSKILQNAKTQDKYNFVKEYFIKNYLSFDIVTEIDVNTKCPRYVSDFLRRYQAIEFTHTDKIRITDTVRLKSLKSVADIKNFFGPASVNFQIAMAMTYLGIFQFRPDISTASINDLRILL